MTTTSSLAFGALLRRHRLAAGLTQEECAGISARGVQDLERGIHAPRPTPTPSVTWPRRWPSPTNSPDSHFENWLNAVSSR